MIFFLKALLMSVLPFYRIDFFADPYSAEVSYLAYSGGDLIGEKMLGSSEINTLKIFLESNKNGWRYDLSTYAPGHFFASSTINVNCSDAGRLVVNDKGDSNEWVQISKQNLEPIPVGGRKFMSMHGEREQGARRPHG